MTIDRVEPPYINGERDSYDAWLEYHRATLLMKCEGLDDEALRARPVPTSLMSLHGLVRHMSEVERAWFRRCLGAEDAPPLYYDDETNPEGDFEIPVAATFADDLAIFERECERSRAIAAAHELDDTGVRRRNDARVSLRWIYVHMIEEYARHNGHADLIRELVGGSIFE